MARSEGEHGNSEELTRVAPCFACLSTPRCASPRPYASYHLVGRGGRQSTARDHEGTAEGPRNRQIVTAYIFGSRTVSITWITPFDWSTSAIVTLATLPFSSSSMMASPS